MNLNQFMVALLRADETSSSLRHQRLSAAAARQSNGATAAAGVSNHEELHTAFHVFDTNSDGFIDESELRLAMQKLTGDTLSDADVNAMIRSADSDGDGLINYDGTIAPHLPPPAPYLFRLLSK